MKNRTAFFAATISGLLAVLAGNTDAQTSQDQANLDSLVQMALRQNAQLKAAASEWRARQAVVPQVSALPDPLLGFGLMNLPTNTFAFDQEPMTGKQISLMQKIPFPGKLGLLGEVADHRARAARAGYLELRNMLVSKVKQTFYELSYLDRAIEVMEKNEKLLSQFVQIARSKYEVGKGLQQDVLQAEVERSKVIDRLISLRQQRQAVETRLNALLNRPPETPIGATPPLEPEPLHVTDLDSLRSIADAQRPLFQMWRQLVQAGEAQVRLAYKEYFPDLSLGVAYTQREVLRSGMGGTDYFSVTAQLNIPLFFWRKQKMRVQQNKLDLVSTEASFENVQAQVYSEIDATFSEIQKNWRLLDLYRSGIIPQASQALKSALVAYQVDKADFLTLLHSQVTLFNYALEFERVKRDYLKGIARLEALVGAEIQ